MSKRFFKAEDGGVDYWFVARDMLHAQSLLVNAGVDLTNEDGDAMEWSELHEVDAWAVRTTNEGRDSKPLAGREIGEWFCSEW